jgi:hypothetical protein
MRVLIAAVYGLGFLLLPALAQRSEAPPPSAGNAAKIARGEYLSNHTSMCDDCHTVHDAHGMPIKEKHLQGAKITFQPNNPLPSSVWTDVAPPLGGLTFLTDQQAVVFFTTGKMPDGKTGRAPMPGHRFSKSDAEALTAYLKALPAVAAR